jgi:hypothetical protein
MLEISNENIVQQRLNAIELYNKTSKVPLNYDDFMYKVLSNLERLESPQYPMTIKIAPSIQKMAEGDFTPSQVLTLNRPLYRGVKIKDDDGKLADSKIPIWFGNSSKGVHLRFGYRNGDSRYPCVLMLDDKDIHGVLGGATGQGKSVALNNLIFNMCEEYPPWEIKLTLCDAKVVEFKKYALESKLPHVNAIAATTDADYLVSVLDTLRTEMIKLNSVFSKVGVSKLEDFRKKTGLVIPQNIIIIDEFQTMFTNAKKKAGKIADILDAFARLGRNTGYHLFLASQELGSDIPKSTLGNIKVRAALGCLADVSTTILGNDEAKIYYGKKGYVLVNNNPANGLKSENVMYRVPFISDDRKADLANELYSLAENSEAKFKYNMTFYDEEAVVRASNNLNYLKNFTNSPNTILLGEPSYVISDAEKIEKLKFNGNDFENIMVLGKSNSQFLRFARLFKDNMILNKGKVQNTVLCANKIIENEVKISEIADTGKYFEEKTYENSKFFLIARTLINRKRLMIAVDNLVFSNKEPNENREDLFAEIIPESDEMYTNTNKVRFNFLYQILKEGGEFTKLYGTGDLKDEDYPKAVQNIAKGMFVSYKMEGCKTSRCTRESFKSQFYWIIGIDKILGLGRDSKNRYVEDLKKLLLDCSEVNARFIIFNTTMEDLASLRSGIRWYLLEELASNEQNRIKCDDFPETRAECLAVLYDVLSTSSEHCFKFKKVILDDEVI